MKTRKGVAAIQSLMAVSVCAMILLGYMGVSRKASDASFGKVQVVLGQDATQDGDTANGGAIRNRGENNGGGSTGGTGSSPTGSGDSGDPQNDDSKNGFVRRLEDLRDKYAAIVEKCETSQGGHVGQSCVLQNQVLELAEQALERARNNSESDVYWITDVLEHSLPNIDDLADPRHWADRTIASGIDTAGQALDAVITPFDFAYRWFLTDDSAGEAWGNAMDNSIYAGPTKDASWRIRRSLAPVQH